MKLKLIAAIAVGAALLSGCASPASQSNTDLIACANAQVTNFASEDKAACKAELAKRSVSADELYAGMVRAKEHDDKLKAASASGAAFGKGLSDAIGKAGDDMSQLADDEAEACLISAACRNGY